MLKFITVLSAALILGLAGSASTATAGGYGKGHHGRGYGGCCGPLPPSYSSNTVYKNKHITKYHDVWRHQYFKRYKKHIHITKIQPILHIHKVTRIHTKRIGVIVPVRVRLTQRLPDRVFVTHSTIHLKPVCGCSSGHGHGGYGRY